jgi:hypothetical protein
MLKQKSCLLVAFLLQTIGLVCMDGRSTPPAENISQEQALLNYRERRAERPQRTAIADEAIDYERRARIARPRLQDELTRFAEQRHQQIESKLNRIEYFLNRAYDDTRTLQEQEDDLNKAYNLHDDILDAIIQQPPFHERVGAISQRINEHRIGQLFHSMLETSDMLHIAYDENTPFARQRELLLNAEHSLQSFVEQGITTRRIQQALGILEQRIHEHPVYRGMHLAPTSPNDQPAPAA